MPKLSFGDGGWVQMIRKTVPDDRSAATWKLVSAEFWLLFSIRPGHHVLQSGETGTTKAGRRRYAEVARLLFPLPVQHRSAHATHGRAGSTRRTGASDAAEGEEWMQSWTGICRRIRCRHRQQQLPRRTEVSIARRLPDCRVVRVANADFVHREHALYPCTYRHWRQRFLKCAAHSITHTLSENQTKLHLHDTRLPRRRQRPKARRHKARCKITHSKLKRRY